jgi:hypothetical protein
MAKKFTLPEKPCELGHKFVTTGEGEGEERKSVAKFSLEALMLTASELDKLLGKGAHERLFTKDKTGASVPFFEDLNEHKPVHRYLESTVTLELDGEVVTMPASKIMGLVLQPQVGGMTWMSCDIETPADLVEGVSDIAQFAGRKIRAQLAFGQKPVADKAQKNLPLNEGEDDDEDDADEQPAKAKKGTNGNGRGVHAEGFEE